MRVLSVLLCLLSGSALAADFGAPFPAEVGAVGISQAVVSPERYAGSEQAFSGRVGKVCQKKGCWMMLTDGETMVRVETGYRYFLPTDAQGKAVVIGRLHAVEVSAEQAEHMARDAGDTQVLADAGREWRIDAASVRIE
jgi:hypothetical protein